MHNINFLKPVPPDHQQYLRSWYWITIGTFILIFFTITLTSGWQLYNLYTLKTASHIDQSKAEKFNPLLKQKNQLKEKIAAISKKTDQLKGLALKTKQHYQLLNAIVKTCNKPLIINSIQLGNGIEELTLFAPSISTVTPYLEKLKKESGIATLAIASLEPEAHRKNGYLVRINQAKKTKQ